MFIIYLNYFVAIILVLCTSVLIYYKISFNYWKKRGVVCMAPKFPYGNLSGFGKNAEHISITIERLYKDYKERGYAYAGLYIFAEPIFVVLKPELVRHILATGFNHFVNRGEYYNERDDPLSCHLVAVKDDAWRELRAKLTSTFTPIKIRNMFQTVLNCSYPFKTALAKLAMEKKPLDIKDYSAMFTTDVIGSCVFGMDCNTINGENEELTEFRRKIFARTKWEAYKFNFVRACPEIAKFLRMRINNAEISDFFIEMIRRTVEYREKNNYERNDFLQLLMQLKNSDNETGRPLTHKFNFNCLAANCFLFFLAGFDTSSTTMNFCLYLLGKHKDIQDKVREEMFEMLTKHNNQLTFEFFADLKYLEQVINETMRLYPPILSLIRECSKEYTVPGTDIVIKKGLKVFIPVKAIQNDPDYYPEPEKFDPDRFSDSNKHNLPPYTHMPFGEGPRICLGSRFAYVVMKIGLFTVIRNFKISLNALTPKTIKFRPQRFLASTEDTLYLDLEKLDGLGSKK